MRTTDNVVTTYNWLTTHSLRSKAECVVFYCLLVHIMYIIHNKAMFIVRETPKVYIKYDIISINNHLLALERIECSKW